MNFFEAKIPIKNLMSLLPLVKICKVNTNLNLQLSINENKCGKDYVDGHIE
jgi:hypothetical protein